MAEVEEVEERVRIALAVVRGFRLDVDAMDRARVGMRRNIVRRR